MPQNSGLNFPIHLKDSSHAEKYLGDEKMLLVHLNIQLELQQRSGFVFVPLVLPAPAGCIAARIAQTLRQISEHRPRFRFVLLRRRFLSLQFGHLSRTRTTHPAEFQNINSSLTYF